MSCSGVDSQTKVCAVIGRPVAHSLSPLLHNTAFSYYGLNWVYLAFEVENLKGAIEGVRGFGVKGLNVTIPYKTDVLAYLDGLDMLAKRIGAVNTIVNHSGHLKGYNTDAQGFLKVLSKEGIDPRGEGFIILGAGGAARAISFVLAQSGARLSVLNRTPERALELSRKLEEEFGRPVPALELNTSNLKFALDNAAVIVNTTSRGMSPDVEGTPVPGELLRPGLTVLDIVYSPLKTRLLREAEAAGAKVVGGLDMLVYQAGLSFELWTGLKAPLEVMMARGCNFLEPKKLERKNSLALTGFMGAGKSSVARLVSSMLGKELRSTDGLVEEAAQKPILRIFSEDGEAYFRELEMRAVKEVLEGDNLVIDCGGGVVLNQLNILNLKKKAHIFYLKSGLDTCLKRAEREVRPLLGHDPGEVFRLFSLREPLYEEAADVVIETSGLNPEEVARKVVEGYESLS